MMSRLIFPLLALFPVPSMAAVSDSFWSNLPMLVTAIGLLLAQLVAAYIAIRTINKKLDVIHETTNSMSHELGVAKKAEGHAEGEKIGELKGHSEGVEDERQRNNGKGPTDAVR